MSRETTTPEEEFLWRVGELVERQDWEAVEKACEAHLDADGECGDAYFLLALAAFTRNDFATSLLFARAALEVAPGNMEYADLLAVLYGMAGDIHNATFHAKLASASTPAQNLKQYIPANLPKFSDAFLDIAERPFFKQGMAASAKGQWSEAEHWLRQHLAFHPHDREANAALGNTLMIEGLHVAAIESLRAARHAVPGDARVAQLLATALMTVGEAAEARSIDRVAIALAPEDPAIFVGAINDLLADPDADVDEIVAMVKEWGQRFGVTQDMIGPEYAPFPKKRLTIGYLVGAMDRSAPARALADILALHNAQSFRIVGFGSGQLSDSFNVVFQKCFESWVDTRDTDPLTFASIVAAEGVDILVDVSGFATPSLLSAFGARLAPLQISWDGCPYGTGLSGMDAILGDAILDPDGAAPMTEKLVRLENGAVLVDLPSPKPVDAIERDENPVFAADVNLGLLDTATVEAWVGILQAVPDAKLILNDRGFHNEYALPRLIGMFGNYGMAHRVDIISGVQIPEFLAQADVFLLPRQVSHTGSAMAALRAGLPVVGWAGEGRHRRIVGSLLHFAGLADELLADSAERYVELAVGWIGDAERRTAFRDGIAGRLEAAPLFDTKARIADLEKAYHGLWQEICPDGSADS